MRITLNISHIGAVRFNCNLKSSSEIFYYFPVYGIHICVTHIFYTATHNRYNDLVKTQEAILNVECEALDQAQKGY